MTFRPPASHVATGFVLCLAFFLIGCRGTHRYIPNPGLSFAGPQPVSPKAGVLNLFTQPGLPYRISFFEADPATGKPIDPGSGLLATGLGGLFLPLVMDAEGFDIKGMNQTTDGLQFTGRLNADVNTLPTWCGEVSGDIKISAEGVPELRLSNEYCNWMGIGNVLVYLRMSMDRIDAEAGRFSGYYSARFHGTGNATGSGFYVAEIGVIGADE